MDRAGLPGVDGLSPRQEGKVRYGVGVRGVYEGRCAHEEVCLGQAVRPLIDERVGFVGVLLEAKKIVQGLGLPAREAILMPVFST
jgi:hypothetical protein